MFPEHEWLPWKFHKAPVMDFEMTKKYVEQIEKDLNIKNKEEWYNVGFADLNQLERVYAVYNRSLYSLLSAVYPDYEWLPWRFQRNRTYYWSDSKNWRTFMEWAGKKLNVKEMKDWYNVTNQVYK